MDHNETSERAQASGCLTTPITTQREEIIMNILIALDSSPTAQAALEAALARHWPPATEFRVLTVLPQKRKWTSDSVHGAYILVDDAAIKIEARNPDSIATALFSEGDAAKCILKHAREWPADLIIVGSHDRGPLERLFMGSVSRAVFQDADCSVLVARSVDESSEVNRILVPIDESLNSQIAVDKLLSSRWPENTYFKLVSAAVVDQRMFGRQAKDMAHVIEQREDYLYGINETLQRTKAKLDVHFGPEYVDCVVREGEPAQVILDTAKEWDAHLIVIGSSERPGVTLKMFGSLAQTVALKAPCSVQAVRWVAAPSRSGIPNAQRPPKQVLSAPVSRRKKI